MTAAKPAAATKTEVLAYSYPSPDSHNKRTRNLIQLVDASEVIYQRIMNHELEAVELSSLARALCDVDKRIRAWKGLPEPGQLRPDSDPVRGLRKGKLRVLDLAPSEGPGETAPDAAQVAKPKRGPFGRPLKATTTAAAPPAPRRAAPQDLATEQPPKVD